MNRKLGSKEPENRQNLNFERGLDPLMVKNRVVRLNSLLREVLSEVIQRDVRNPHVNQLVTVTRVEITKDLHYAKVYISVIGSDLERAQTIEALQSAAGFIAIHASKKVVMRYFPALTFKLDTSVDHQFKIDTLLNQIHHEQQTRISPDERNPSAD